MVVLIFGYDLFVIGDVIVVVKSVDCFSFIVCKMIIGFGLFNKLGKVLLYGVFFGLDEIEFIKKELNWLF